MVMEIGLCLVWAEVKGKRSGKDMKTVTTESRTHQEMPSDWGRFTSNLCLSIFSVVSLFPSRT